MDKIAPCIRKLALSLAVLSAMLLPRFTRLRLTRSYGTRGSPKRRRRQSLHRKVTCETFARALTQTDSGGEVSCLNSGSYYKQPRHSPSRNRSPSTAMESRHGRVVTRWSSMAMLSPSTDQA